MDATHTQIFCNFTQKRITALYNYSCTFANSCNFIASLTVFAIFSWKNATKATEQPSTRGIDRTVQFFWKSHLSSMWRGGRKGASKAEKSQAFRNIWTWMLACEYFEKWTPLWGWHQLSYAVRGASRPGISTMREFAWPRGFSALQGLDCSRLACFSCWAAVATLPGWNHTWFSQIF